MNTRFPTTGRVLILMALLLALALPSMVAAAPPACTTTLVAGADIQAAINAASAGDVICLSAGTYTPAATLHVNKALTLQGPQAGVDPRPSEGSARVPGGAAEAIITGAGTLGTVIQIESSGVVLDGFEVINGVADLIASLAGSNVANVTVRNLIVHQATGDEGMQIRDCDTCVIEYNYVYDTFGDGINLCCGSVNGLIQFNELIGIDSENAALYVYEATETTIQCNLVDTTSINEGIKLGTKGGTDAALSGGRILYNVVRNTRQDGIAIYMSDTDVTGNDVTASTSENGAIYVAQGVSNILITYNALHNNALQTFKWGDPGAVMIGSGGAQSAATVQVANNNITTNTPNGATNKGTGTLNAENNWWGAADGPSDAGPGAGDAVSTNVDFDPWLTQPAVIPPGPCARGTITVVKQTTPAGDPADFEFDPSWPGPNFTLSDGESVTSALLPAGSYSVAEVSLPARWVQTDAECVNGAQTADPSAITLADGDAWVCTFENKYVPLCTTDCYVDAATGSDANGGTSFADAFKTIQKGIDTVQAGGTVHLAAGTFYENAATGWRELYITKSLSLVGAGSGVSIIQLPMKTNGVEIFGNNLTVHLKGVTFTRLPANTYAADFNVRVAETASSNMTITFDDVESAYARSQNANLGSAGTYASVTVLNSNFHHAGSWGFSIAGAATDVTVTNSHFDNNGVVDLTQAIGLNLTAGAGISNVAITGGTFNNNGSINTNGSKGINMVKVTGVTIDGIVAHGNFDGVILWEWVGTSTNVSITNSDLSGNRRSITIGSETGKTVDGVTITGNQLNNNLNYGVLIYRAAGWGEGVITNVRINRNDVSQDPNSGISLAMPYEEVDGTCNWWGDASGPGPFGPGTGSYVSAGVDFTPWLRVNDLDADTPCFIGGTIKVSKVTNPATDTTTEFEFDPSWSATNFKLKNGESATSAALPAGNYSVTELNQPNWTLSSASCDNTATVAVEAVAPTNITVADGDAWVCTFNNTYTPPPPPQTVYVSADNAGSVGAVTFGGEDILKWNGAAWSKWFDGSNAGLTSSGNKDNIDAFYIPNTASTSVIFSLSGYDRKLPNIHDRLKGEDLVLWNGTKLYLYFEGDEVGLKEKSENIDALHILPGSMSPIGSGCQVYLLISTLGSGEVKDYRNKTLKFGGEDILGFCLTKYGEETAGKWHMVLDGSTQGMPKDSLDSLSVSADGLTY
uniref:hypothetical protein n=1 Tax=Promineifilum sp. TaxID=2664178 RepID=UPI0035B2DDBA